MPMSFANGILLVDNYAVPDVLARLVLVLLVVDNRHSCPVPSVAAAAFLRSTIRPRYHPTV